MQRHLLVYLKDDLIRSINLGHSELLIGRHRECSLRIDDLKVSARHCRILNEGDRFYLEDYHGSTGTLVGGEPIERVELHPGDEFRVGPYRLQVVEGPAPLLRLKTTTGSLSPAPRPPADMMSRLSEFTRRMVGITDLQTVLETLLDHTLELVGGRKGYVVLADGAELSPILASRGVDTTADHQFSRTVCHRAVESAQPLLMNLEDLDLAEKATASLKQFDIGTVLAIPLVFAGKAFGVLHLETEKPMPAEHRGCADVWKEISWVGGKAIQAAAERQQLVMNEDRWHWVAKLASEGLELGRSWKSTAMAELLALVERLAREDVTALIVGETGTGKEVIARTIHRWSPRSRGPFVAVNCAAIPRELIEAELFGYEKGAFTGAALSRPGRFELAQGGTLFLDEIGSLPVELQVKLLRAVESRCMERLGGGALLRWDARLLAATNQNLEELVRVGEFRKDLYYRLNVVQVVMPALRDRRSDIVQLVEEILRECNRRFRRKLFAISPDALATLEAYDWPGNIRELRNVIERAFVLEPGDQISTASLPFSHTPAAARLSAQLSSTPVTPAHVVPLKEFLERQEREYIALILDQCEGNVSQAGALLKLARSALYKKVTDMGIRPKSKLQG